MRLFRICVLLILTVVPALGLGVAGASPALADGLDFSCGKAGPPSPVTDVEVFTTLQITFDGTGPAGQTVHRAFSLDTTLAQFDRFSEFRVGSVDLVTGGANVEYANMSAVDLDSDSTPDIMFVAGPRLSSAPATGGSGTGPNPVDPMMTQNFGEARDYPAFLPRYVGGVGVDLRVLRTSPVAADWMGQFGVSLVYTRGDGSQVHQRVRIGLDARPDQLTTSHGAVPRRLPTESRLSLLFRISPDRIRGSWALGQEFEYSDVAPGTQRPGIGVTLDVDKITATGAPLGTEITTSLGYTVAPEDLGAGVRQSCVHVEDFPSMAQLGWNRTLESATAVAPTTTVSVRTGLGQGLGSTPGAPVDEVSLSATVAPMPRRLDYVAHPDDLTIARSGEAAPDIGLAGMQIAMQDWTNPFVVSGRVAGLPERTEMAVARPDGDITAGRIVFCPTAPVAVAVPSVPYAPCSAGSAPRPASVTVVAQNFLVGTAGTQDLPDAPSDPPGGQFLLAAKRGAQGAGDNELFRYGARVSGPESVDFDLDYTAPSGAKGLSARVVSDGGSPAHLTAWIDGRTNLSVLHDGWLISTEATVSPLAADVSVRYAASDSQPLYAEVTSSEPVSLDGTARLEGPNGGCCLVNPFGLLEVDGRFRIGGDGAGLRHAELGLERNVDPGGATANRVRYDADTAVPATAGALVTDFGDRVSNWRTRAHVELLTPAHLEAGWNEDAGGRVTHADFSGCTITEVPIEPAPGGDTGSIGTKANQTESGSGGDKGSTGAKTKRIETCTPNRLLGTVVRGHPDASDADLLVPPAVPDVADGHPDFGSWNETGVRAVRLEDGRWGVRAGFVDLRSASYDAEPQTVCLRTSHREGAEPFGLNIYDHSAAPTTVYVNGSVANFPDTLQARIASRPSATDETPWIWLNTEACGGDAPTSLEQTEVPSETAPHLEATVRYGDDGAFSPFLPPNGGLLPPVHPGADIVVRRILDKTAMHARIVEQLPRQLMLWSPQRCTQATAEATLRLCQNAPHYGPDDVTDIGVKFLSSAQSLGSLTVRGWRLSAAPAFDEFGVDAGVIPGRVDGQVRLSTNRRIDRTDVSVHFDANVGLGDVAGYMADFLHPAYRGPGPQNRTSDNVVPKLKLKLGSVPARFDASAKLHFAEAPNAGPAVPERCDDGTAPAGPTGLEYLDQEIQLGPDVHWVDVSMYRGREDGLGQLTTADDTPETAIALRSDAPVSAVTRAKLKNIFVKYHDDPWWGYFDVCLDFDLGLRLQVDNATDVHIGQATDRVVVDLSDADVNRGANVHGSSGERFVCHAFCPVLGEMVDRGGAYYRRHSYDIEVHIPGFGFDTSSAARSNIVRDIDWVDASDDCSDHPCYFNEDGFNDDYAFDFRRDPEFRIYGSPRLAGYQSAEMLMDPLFGYYERQRLWNFDEAGVGVYRPGGKIFSAIADLSRSPKVFGVPFGQLRTAPLDGSGTGLLLPTNFTTPNFGLCPSRPQEEEIGSHAVGNDLTLYSIAMRRQCARSNLERDKAWAYLVARFPDGRLRWTRQIGVAVLPTATSRYGVRLTPYGDGSVCAFVTGLNGSSSSRAGCLDNSGYGMFYDTSIIAIGPVQYTTLGVPVTMNAGALASGAVSRIWYHGDGRATSGGATLSRAYDLRGHYIAVAVDYDSKGRVVAARRFYPIVQ